MRYLFNVLYLATLVITLPFWIFKALTTGKYRRGFWDRLFGASLATSDQRPAIWFHAVSVGEVLLLKPLIARFLAVRPDVRVVLSTTTATGFATAKKTYPDVEVFFSPLDFSWAVDRVLKQLSPKLLVLAELELWPNLLMSAQQRSIPVAVVNARLSDRSYRGYRRFERALRRPLAAISWWGAQSEQYADRIVNLVVDANVSVTGSMKYDSAKVDRDNPKTNELRQLLGFAPNERIFVAGSTQLIEEPVVIDAFRRLQNRFRNLRLIIVPRHPGHFNATADFLTKSQIEFSRRSEIEVAMDQSAPITLVDTIGELSAVWGLADFAFVGGSLGGNRGGQSMIEPAAFGVAACFGPETWNFADTVEKLLAIKGAVQLSESTDLLPTLAGWLEDPESARQLGANAQTFICSQRGAVDRTFAKLCELSPRKNTQRSAA